MSKNSTFTVGISGGGIQSGITFLNLETLSLTQRDEKGNPLRETTHRIFLTPEATLETFNFLKGALDRLVDIGVMKAQGKDQDSGEDQNGGAKAKPQSGQPSSPNFSQK